MGQARGRRGGRGLPDTQATLKEQLATLQTENAKLSAQVIESPSDLKQTMTERTASLQKEQEAAAELERKLREVAARLEILANIEQDVDRCTKLLAECEIEQQRLEEARRAEAAGQENIHRLESNIRDLGLKDQVAYLAAGSIPPPPLPPPPSLLLLRANERNWTGTDARRCACAFWRCGLHRLCSKPSGSSRACMKSSRASNDSRRCGARPLTRASRPCATSTASWPASTWRSSGKFRTWTS